jgi:hypothetical protein
MKTSSPITKPTYEPTSRPVVYGDAIGVKNQYWPTPRPTKMPLAPTLQPIPYSPTDAPVTPDVAAGADALEFDDDDTEYCWKDSYTRGVGPSFGFLRFICILNYYYY